MFNSSRFLIIGSLFILNIQQPSAFAQTAQTTDLPKNAKRGQGRLNKGVISIDEFQLEPRRKKTLLETQFPIGNATNNSNYVWRFVKTLELGSFPHCSDDAAIKAKIITIIIKAKRDNLIHADDLMELSALYRENGQNMGADDALGTALTLLDSEVPTEEFKKRYPSFGRIGGLHRFTLTRDFTAQQFMESLSSYQHHLGREDYSAASEEFLKSLDLFLYNPLLLSEVKDIDLDAEMNKFRGQVTKDRWVALNTAKALVERRLMVLENVPSLATTYEEQQAETEEEQQPGDSLPVPTKSSL